MALSGASEALPAINLLVRRLVGALFSTTPFDKVCRRPNPALGEDGDAGEASRMAAVIAATLDAPLFIDFRRVTRLFELMGPGPRRDWELVREWDCRFARPDVGIVDDRVGR